MKNMKERGMERKDGGRKERKKNEGMKERNTKELRYK
jgi:hypothetical protein